jgi:diadenosine tetraphosphatase ApaH/serine/threonine PP2A family protein phosphatase/pyruvate-formate lyase-activating enzyme
MPRFAVCGGVYANPYALSAMREDAARNGCERIFCLGDLGGFGAECNAVWPLLLEPWITCIAGNYDIAIARGDADCGCGYRDPRDNEFAQVMYDYTREHTDPEFAAWMGSLPVEHRERMGGLDVHMVHGSPLAVNDFMWESLDDDELRLRLDASGADVLLCTHTGLHWQRRLDGRLVVNVGAIGRPANDGCRECWYAILEIDDGRVGADFVPVAYDWRAHAAAMRSAGLPEPFVETIETGWWTTCLEIVPPPERSRGRYQVYRDVFPEGSGGEEVGWAQPATPKEGDRPVLALFDSPLFPARLWVYSNFHCNLACDYCVVASSPTALPRSIGLERFCRLVDEAVAEGFRELYVTGGEPFVEPDIVPMLEYASDRLPTVVLTNAMLFTTRRGRDLRRLAGRERLVLQTSLDGARPETHDAWRGAGSWRRAMDGIARATTLGLRVRVAMTETPDNRHEGEELRALLATYDIGDDDIAIRPLIKRGFAASVEAATDIRLADLIPELTITADGVHWHPLGADVASSPDMLLEPRILPLAEAKRLIIERFLNLRLADGSLPQPVRCAI